MSVEHMAMVFAAKGIPGPEKTLLLAFTNFTDAHGYCWPGEQRLADMTGTSVRTVRRSRAKLIELRLIKSVRRNEKGEPTTNLTRVNLRLLASMRRPERVYDDNLVERLSFEGTDSPEGTEGGALDPEAPPDLLTGQSVLRQGTDCPEGEDTLASGSGQIGPLSISDPSGCPPASHQSPDARRATTGSRGSRVSGSAASGNESQHEGTTSPAAAGREPDGSRSAVQRTTGSTGSKGGSAASSDKKPITNIQRAQVQAVRDLLPPLLARDLPDETPTNISEKILAALDTDGPRPRTPEQLAAYRINPRWDGYWATQYGDDGFDKPLGVVLALVASQAECGNVRCDDRRDVDTGELCPFCVELKADRRVQRRLEQRDAVRAAERPSEPRGGRSGDVVPPPRPEAVSWAPAAPGAWPTVVAPAEDTPVVSTVEIPSPDEVQARTADMRSLLRENRNRPARAPF